MRNILLLFLAATLILMSCKPKPEGEETIATEDAIDPPPPVEAPLGDCYLAVSGKDSILMQVVIENNTTVAGHLAHRFFEKDKSSGTIIGYMSGDTLIADYKFMSEGIESEREVVFLRKGDVFIEGYGEVQERGGRMVFKNISTASFDGWPMQKTDCAALAMYFPK